MKMEIIRMRTGLVWYNERDYVAARKIMVDGAAWSETFASWLEKAEALVQRFQYSNHIRRTELQHFLGQRCKPASVKFHGIDELGI